MEITLHPSASPIQPRKIFAIGRNYAKHARELGNQVPGKPVVFMKPLTALWPSDQPIPFPRHGKELHHEAELVVLIGKGGRHITAEAALDHVAGYGIGLDLTLRDVQQELKSGGLPWELAKAFDASAPIGLFTRSVSDPQNLRIRCEVNGVCRQDGNTGDMIFPIPVLISYLSGIFTLEPGDLIFTGTPDGVGPLNSGDVVSVSISEIGETVFTVGS
ncbi:MAG: fumarylacetoacetate hydrolase family protein [Bacteroidetes bacterium]|nr:fumarylacetoacetate hydrolase family protein [Bacteroidota bacterium]